MSYISELESDFFNSSYFQVGMNYNKNFNSVDELLHDGVYYDNKSNSYIRPVNVVYKEQSGEVAFLVKVEPTGQGEQIHAQSVGVFSPIMVEDALYSISYGLGAKWDKTSNDFIQMTNDAIDEFGNEVYSVVTDVRKISDNVVEWVNDYIINKYGDIPISDKYLYETITRPTGQSTLIDWDNSTFIDANSGIYADNNTPIYNYYSGVDSEEMHNILENAKKNDLVKNIFSNAEIISVYYDPQMYPNDDIRIYIWGYDIDNNIVNVGNDSDGQYITCTTNKVGGVMYNATLGTIEEHTPPNRDTFYNYPHGWTMAHIGMVVDSIGYIGKIKPYETLPLSGLWTHNPDNTYDVGEPDEDDETPEEDKQVIVRYGIIPPKIIIITHRIKGKTKVITRDEETTPMDTEVPTPDDGALYHMHQISESMLKKFSSKLWDRTFIEQLKEIWTNNPLDGVISLHQVYYSPNLKRGSGGAPEVDKLVLGYLKMNDVDVWNISNRYQELNFGSIPITKIFEDRRDYEREIIIYLPFIGFNQLDMSDLVGATKQTSIQLKYIVDNLTGDCVATLYINKDGNKDNKILYMFSGNCASQLPLTSADRTQLISSTIGTIGGVISSTVGGFARGGAMGAVGGVAGGVVGGALQALGNTQANITKSGNVSGNMGAMSYKYAFVVINSPISQDAENFAKYGGYSTNVTTTLSYCKGFTRMTECIIDNVPCTSYEMDTIKNILASGIIV